MSESNPLTRVNMQRHEESESKERKKAFWSRICHWIYSTVTLGLTGFLIWDFLGRPSARDARDFISDIDFGDFTDVLANLTDNDWLDGFNEDPFVGDNSTEAWETDGYGLALEIQNALDETWQTEFENAINDWKESPVLTLTTPTVDVDHFCHQTRGVMRVCNGNYGNTGWLGINEVLLETWGLRPTFIVSSVAKMNEYYLLNANYAKRQYTMCHEIGHGFGLPHTDVNFRNADLGNCLDYTNRPQNNLHPGEVNFQRLESIYMRDYNPETDNADGEVRRVLRTYYLWNYN